MSAPRPSRQSKRRAASLIEASSMSAGAGATQQAKVKGLEHFYVDYVLDEESPEVREIGQIGREPTHVVALVLAKCR